MPRLDQFDPDSYRACANLAEAFFSNADRHPTLIAWDQAQIVERQLGPRRYLATTQAQAKARVLQIAAHLQRRGVHPGDRVVILALDRPEWTEAEMAIYTVGAVLVGAYVRDPLDRLHHILHDSGARFALIENREQWHKLVRLTTQPAPDSQLPPLALAAAVTFEPLEPGDESLLPNVPVTSLPEILSAAQAEPGAEAFAWRQTKRDDLACIFYTSASSGPSRGVPVTHGQVLENLRQIARAGLVDYRRFDLSGPRVRQPIVTSILPERAHMYPARVAQLVATSPARGRFPAVVSRHWSQITTEFRESVRRDLREGGAGVVVVVPKILIAIEKLVRRGLAQGGWRERLAQRVVAQATKTLLAEARGEVPLAGRLAWLALAPLRQRVARTIRRRVVGRQFDFFVSGGAKLPLETAALLWAIGLPVYEGYGSTESNCPIAVGTRRAQRLGSVGKAFDEIELRVAASGELLIRGPNVARGYWHLPDQSAAAFTADGWYHTRDLAHLDDEGFLYVDDRLDNVLALVNGEKVSAADMECRLLSLPCVETAIVLGQGRPGLVALIEPHEAAIREWARRARHPLGDAWRDDPAVLAYVRRQVEELVNARAGRPYERIRNLALIDPPHPDRKTLTATEKVSRREIGRQYASLIEQLYAESPPHPDEVAGALSWVRAAAL